jgi:hypothetical protein
MPARGRDVPMRTIGASLFVLGIEWFRENGNSSSGDGSNYSEWADESRLNAQFVGQSSHDEVQVTIRLAVRVWF